MNKVKFIRTTNPLMKKYVGLIGNLEKDKDKTFNFFFKLDQIHRGTMSSKYLRELNDFKSSISDEICFITNNASYVFKKEN